MYAPFLGSRYPYQWRLAKCSSEQASGVPCKARLTKRCYAGRTAQVGLSERGIDAH